MSEPGYCIHQHRRDVESCPYCELIKVTAERDALRERVARLEGEVGRWKQEFRSYAVHDDARCEHFGKCQCGLAELLAECAEGGEP